MTISLPRSSGGQGGPPLSQLSRLSGQCGLGQITLAEEERSYKCLFLGGFKKNHRDSQLSRKEKTMGSINRAWREDLELSNTGLILDLAGTCLLMLTSDKRFPCLTLRFSICNWGVLRWRGSICRAPWTKNLDPKLVLTTKVGAGIQLPVPTPDGSAGTTVWLHRRHMSQKGGGGGGVCPK